MNTSQTDATTAAQKRRSLVYRLLQAAGARFGAVNGGAAALDFGRPADEEIAQARSLGLADLSVLPRTGFKGVGAVEWLTEQGLQIGAASNKAYRQPSGVLAARLSPTEVMLLDAFDGAGTMIARIEGAWNRASELPRRPIGYPMPRSESHAWFVVSGRLAPTLFAKICGIDLRLHRFSDGNVAQTSVAKMNAIVIRADAGITPGFHLLADSASAEYLCNCVVDAMEEFGGALVGLSALRQLAAET